MRRRSPAYSLPGVLLIAASAVAGDATNAIVERPNLTYAKRGDLELQLDIAHPKIGDLPRPIVVCIHGGGWRMGERQHYGEVVRKLARRGYVAATVTYRLSEIAQWPAQLEDVRSAIEWVRSHASEFGGDPARIGVTGASAGGHLSLMLGVLSDREERPRSTVQAVVNVFGPTDMRGPEGWPEGSRRLIEFLAGGSYAEKKSTYWDFSPVTHLSRGDAPVLTFHGTKDRIVPVEQATMFHRELDRIGVPHRLELIEGADHGWGGERRAKTEAETYAFFDRYLRAGPLPLVAIDDFESGHARWEFTDETSWRLDGSKNRRFLRLFEKKNSYRPKVRSPFHIALLKDVAVGDFALDVTIRSTIPDYPHRDLCLFFGYQGPSKFYYVHLGKRGDDHANSIFLVNDKPRKTIARERTMGIDWDDAWHRVRIHRSVSDGRIDVYFDDMSRPVMSAVDKTFLAGRVGVGSFDDTGDFDEVRLYGRSADGDERSGDR